MAQGQVRTLISFLIVLALAGAFLWGGSHLLGSIAGSASPVTTPTPQVVVEQPGATATTRPVKRRRTTPTPPTRTPPPAPTPTPNTPPKVFIALDNVGTGEAGTYSLGGGPKKIFCLVRNSALPPGTANLRIDWIQNGLAFFQYPSQVQIGTYSYSYDPLSNPGKYRCAITVNGATKPFASADFTLTP